MAKLNHINNSRLSKDSQLEKVKLGLPIFKRTLFRVLGSTTFIVMTSILTFAFLLIVILGNFIIMPESFGATSTILLTWVPFIIMAVYVVYFELHQISVVYNKEIKDGIINLEIRSGYSKTRIFAERLLANKAIIWSWILVMILLYATIGGLNPNLIPHEIALNRVGSLSLIIIFDLFMTGILMLFASTSSSVFMGVLATIISLMYMAAPGISLAYAPDAEYRKNMNFDSEDKAAKYEFMYKLQELEKNMVVKIP